MARIPPPASGGLVVSDGATTAATLPGASRRGVVVIPTYNEVENIGHLVPEILAQDPGLDVLVVDDGSPDGTARIVRDLPDFGRRVALIERAVPGVRKAVKWNSPFYGVEGQGWFLGVHCMTKYVKLGFFRGESLHPPPPGESKQKDVRYLDIHEDDPLDEAQLASWVKQASLLPGWGKS